MKNPTIKKKIELDDSKMLKEMKANNTKNNKPFQNSIHEHPKMMKNTIKKNKRSNQQTNNLYKIKNKVDFSEDEEDSDAETLYSEERSEEESEIHTSDDDFIDDSQLITKTKKRMLR